MESRASLARRLLAASALCVAASVAGAVAWAGSVDIGLNDKAARLTVGVGAASGRLEIDGGWLHVDADDAEGDLVHLGLSRVGHTSAGRASIDAGVGGRIVYPDADGGGDGVALALGGSARYWLPPAPRVSIRAGIYFGPGVLSAGDVERYLEWHVGAGFRVFEGAEVYAGYRQVTAEYDGLADVDFDDDLHAGIRFDF